MRADTKEAEHDKVWPHYSLSLGLPDVEKPIVGQRALRIPTRMSGVMAVGGEEAVLETA